LSFHFIVDVFSLRIEVKRAVESLKEDSTLEKSLLVVTLGAVDILESEPILFSSLSSKDKAKTSEEAFLEIEEVGMLFENLTLLLYSLPRYPLEVKTTLDSRPVH